MASIRSVAAWGAMVLTLAGCGGKGGRTDGPTFQEQVASAMRETAPDARAKQLARIGYQQAKAADERGAREPLRLAGEAAQKVEEPVARAGAFTLLARAEARSGFKAEARASLATAMESAERIELGEMRARQWGEIASVQWAAGDADAARRSLASAEKIAATLTDFQGQPDPYTQALVLSAIAQTYQELQAPADVARVLAAAVDRAGQLSDLFSQSRALVAIGSAQQTTGHGKAAETFAQAHAAAGKVEKPHQRALVLAELAQAQAEAKLAADAGATLAEADRTVDAIPEADLQRQAREAVERIRPLVPAGP